MIGLYRNIDGSEYEVFYDNVSDGKKKVLTLMARCVKSQTKPTTPFPMNELNLEKNIRHMLWIKIE